MQSSKLWKILQHGNVENLQKLGADICSEDFIKLLQFTHKKSGDTVLHVIARHNHLPMFKWVHNVCKEHLCLDSVNLDGKTPLHESAFSCNVDIVRYILANGGKNVDPLKRAGWTPLMMAATKSNCLSTVKLLIEAGANSSLVNKDGWNVFHIACRTGDLKTLEFLCKISPQIWDTTSTNGRRPIHTAAIHGLTHVVKYLFVSGHARADEVDGCGSTPLMEAIRSGNTETVQFILNTAPGCLQITDKLGRNCLHIAAQAGHSTLLEFLVNTRHVDVNSTVLMETSMCQGQTALHFAYQYDNSDAVDCLIALGASEDILDGHGRTPKSLRKIHSYSQYRIHV